MTDREDRLVVHELVVDYHVRRGVQQHVVRAVDHVSFEVPAGASVGLVGESGSGKSTIARAIVGLAPIASGTIAFGGEQIGGQSGHRTRHRRAIQMVFQDPYSSLNPWMTIEEIVAEGLIVHSLVRGAKDRRRRVVELLELVGLDDSALGRRARAFSGGQRQRIAIARALAVQPRLLICDEAVSSLDVSVQAQIVNLLIDLRRRLGLGLLFIGHDLAIVCTVTDNVLVMDDGRLVDAGSSASLFDDPTSETTRTLVAAVPRGFTLLSEDEAE
jgi:ABC-type glutathione transport system ATPase component